MQAVPVNLERHKELTVSEVAELKKCSPQYIRKLLDDGLLCGEKRLNERNRPTYYIPLASLPAELQKRYFKEEKGAVKKKAKAVPLRSRPLEQYSLEEQKQISFWRLLVEDWQQYRSTRADIPKSDADAQYIMYATVAYQDKYQALFGGKEFQLSIQMLYRRWRAYKENDMDTMLDKRGTAKRGESGIPPKVWDAFLSYYLDEAQHPISRCYEYSRLWVMETCPELYEDIPSVSSFYRRVERDIPEPLKVLGREGEKAYRDRCAPYIRRVYDDMESNEYWVADTHTLDVISNDEDGRQHRMYLVAFFDARSGIFTGCYLADQPGSQPTLTALRKGIQKYGIPQYIYVDNGREFLTHDVGGLGHRARKKHLDEFSPPPVFQRLGITMVNAQVRNARAKIIERRFRDVKDHLSRLFPTYTGGNVVERPEQLKYNLKAGKIIADTELTVIVETVLEHYFNRQPYGGAVARDRGKSRAQVYQENLHTKRVASEDDLNLLMMRSSRVQTVGRRGVHLTIGGVRFDYWNDELVQMMFGQKVYFRYDPEALGEVRVYNLEDRLLTVAPMDSETVREHGASKDELQAAIKRIRQVERAQKVLLDNSGLETCERISAVDLILAQANRNKENTAAGSSAKIVELQRVLETPLLEAVSGLNDMDTMLRNAERYHKGGTDDE